MTVTEDRTKEILDIINSFRNDKVLVGIPAGDTRKPEPGEKNDGISNAALLFINNFGSPANNIPPRPVMEIGIKAAQADIAAEFASAIAKSWKKGMPAINLYYERIGMIASNSIKKVINEQIGIAGPAESTLKSRKSKGFSGKKSLVMTGQMRNAITYVVDKGG